jgi:3-keto-disaccharide hydrolase
LDRSTPAISPLGPYTSQAAAVIARRTRLVPALLAAALLACALPAAKALEPKTTIDIGHNAGAPPAHFDFLPDGGGQRNPWTLIEDGAAVAGLAIERRSTSTVDHSLAIYSAASPKDAEISLRIKATGGTEDQGGGIALRLTAPDSYYLVEMDARRDRVVFLRVANGATEEIVGVDADIATNEWHRLAVRVVDDEFVITLDGIWVFTGFDKTLSRAGRVALWTKGDSITRFDQIEIEPLQRDPS